VGNDSSLAADVRVKALKISLGGSGLTTAPDAKVSSNLDGAGTALKLEQIQDVVQGLKHGRVLKGLEDAGMCLEVRHKSSSSAEIGSVLQFLLYQRHWG